MVYRACMNSALYLKLQNDLTKIRGLISEAEKGILAIASGGVASFELDTGEADQQVRFSNVKTFQNFLNGLQLKEEWLMRRLRGGTMTSLKVRRKP